VDAKDKFFSKWKKFKGIIKAFKSHAQPTVLLIPNSPLIFNKIIPIKKIENKSMNTNFIKKMKYFISLILFMRFLWNDKVAHYQQQSKI